MAEIVKIRFLLLLPLLIFPSLLPAQEKNIPGKKKVEILHSDEGFFEGDLRRLRFNVRLKHKETYMTCDSAHYYESADLVKAFGNIHIFKGDTLHLYGQHLIYDSRAETAEVSDGVIFINNKTTLYTDHIFYDMANEVARYETGGKILNEDNVLTSKIGIYYTKENILNFKDSVMLVNPDYTMYSDTLVYNTETEIAFFHGPTEVVGDSLRTRCEEGWHDTRNEITLLKGNARVDNLKQIITADSIYYEAENGYGTAFFDVTISDLTRDVIVKGNKAWYYEDPEMFTITDSAQFIQVSDGEFMYLHADTLKSVVSAIDSANDKRLLRAWYGCRLFSDDLQAKCDSISYSLTDSVIKMYYEPILWSEDNQLTADSVFLFTENDAMERMELYNSAFVIEQIDPDRFNQIKGKNLTGYFRENKIYLIEVRGNGENIYYAIENEQLMGVNQSTCANMDIYIEDGNIKRIFMLSSPEGSLDPPLHISASARKLDNFNWLEELKPKDRYDIFRRKK